MLQCSLLELQFSASLRFYPWQVHVEHIAHVELKIGLKTAKSLLVDLVKLLGINACVQLSTAPHPISALSEDELLGVQYHPNLGLADQWNMLLEGCFHICMHNSK